MAMRECLLPPYIRLTFKFQVRQIYCNIKSDDTKWFPLNANVRHVVPTPRRTQHMRASRE